MPSPNKLNWNCTTLLKVRLISHSVPVKSKKKKKIGRLIRMFWFISTWLHICASSSAPVEPGKFDLVYQNADGTERVEYAVSRDSRVWIHSNAAHKQKNSYANFFFFLTPAAYWRKVKCIHFFFFLRCFVLLLLVIKCITFPLSGNWTLGVPAGTEVDHLNESYHWTLTKYYAAAQESLHYCSCVILGF